MVIIRNTSFLTGDFRATKINFSVTDLLFLLVFVLTSSGLVLLLNRIHVRPIIAERKIKEDILFYLFLAIILINVCFGSQKVGVHSDNYVTALVSKLSPEFIFFLICAKSKRVSHIMISSIGILILSLLKISMFGLLTVFFGLYIFMHSRDLPLLKKIIAIMVVFIVAVFSGSALIFIYESRAALRGMELDISQGELLVLIVGRLTSYSSFQFALMHISEIKIVSSLQPVTALMSVFFKLSFAEAGQGVTAVFNEFIGTDGYAIFIGFPTALFILLNQSILSLSVFVLVWSVLFLFVKCLVPYCRGRNLIVSSLLIPILISGSTWELMILVEKMVFVIVLYSIVIKIRWAKT